MIRKRAGLLAAMAAGAFLVFGAAGPAGAQTFGKNKIQYKDFHWEVVSSPHFEVYYYQGGRQLAERVVAIAERANIQLSRDLDHRLSRKVPILVYNSHNDFAQTNVTTELLDESTGGFTEVFKSRVVIPFTGSYEELRHVVVHELTHAFQFDILYGGPFDSLLGRANSINVPLWLAEGMAEYESLQMEPGAEQFMRDGVIHGYLVPLEYDPGGYLVYKEGQSAMAYIVRRYGAEKYAELIHRVRTYRSMDRALERTLGVTVKKFSADWIKDLKKQYWPQVATLDDPEKFARRLTDHEKDQSSLNTSPAISPDGDKVAYLSDRKIYTDLYLMSAIDGKVLRRLVRGSRSRQFESIPSFRSSLAWSPDGKQLAFVAKAGEADEIYVYDLRKNRVIQELKFALDGIGYPAFTPDGAGLVFVGLRDGRNDIYRTRVAGGPLARLTEDDFDEKDLTFAPDSSLTFASDRHGPLDLSAEHHQGAAGTYGIYSLNLGTRAVREIFYSGNNDVAPAWSVDGRRLAFISQRDHGQNLFVYTPADSSVTQITELVGGIYNVSWSRRGDRLVFSALNNGGWDVFASRDSLSADGTMASLRKANPSEAFTLGAFAFRPDTSAARRAPLAALASPARPAAAPVAAAAAPDSAFQAARADTSDSTLSRGIARVGTPGPVPKRRGFLSDSSFAAGADSLAPRGPRITLEDSLRAEALADSAHLLAGAPYRARFSPDYLTGGFQYNSLLGFGGSTQFSVSDFLGNHRFFVATDLFTSSLDETNFLALYNYLPRRTDYAVGLFHFKNYYFSRVTGLGEQFADPRYFSERNYGVVGQLSYPFNKFRRLDFDLSFQVDRRVLFDDTASYLVARAETTSFLAAPTLSLVSDKALYTYFGPLDGSRWTASASQAIPVGGSSLSYTTLSLDYRKYLHLGSGYRIAFRTLGIGSVGRDPQTFFLGGATSLRGYDPPGAGLGALGTQGGALLAGAALPVHLAPGAQRAAAAVHLQHPGRAVRGRGGGLERRAARLQPRERRAQAEGSAGQLRPRHARRAGLLPGASRRRLADPADPDQPDQEAALALLHWSGVLSFSRG